MILLVDCSCWHYYRLPIVRPMLNSCFGLHVWNAEIVWLNELWGIQRNCKITIPKLPTKFHRTSSDALVRGQRLCLCWEEFCLGCCWGSGTTRVGSCIAVARTFWTAMLVQWLFVVVEISQKQKKTFESPKKDSVDGWWKHDNIWIYLITSSHLLWTLFQHATLLLQRLMWHYDMADNAQLASYITVILPLWLRNSDANTSPLLDPLSKTNSPGRKVFRSKQKEKHAALGWPAACIIQPSVVRRKGTRSPRVVAPGLYRDALKKLWMLSQQQEGVPNSS